MGTGRNGGRAIVATGLGQCCWDTLAVVDSYPSPDSKAEAAVWAEQAGGPTATALVALARLGIPCRFAGVVGDDDAGSRIRQALDSEGVDGAFLVTRRGGASQRAFIMIERGSGRRTIVWRRPTGDPLDPREVPDAFLAGSSLLLLDGLMADASLHAAGRARSLGIPVMVDAGRMRPGMLDITRQCDYVVAAEQFFLDLGWDRTPEHFRGLAADLGAPVVTVTLGAAGSLTWSGNEPFHVPAFTVDAVDTTGAGDVFHGGYGYGILQGWSVRETVVFASAMAAMKCRQVGAQQGIPRLPDVSDFLARRNITVLPNPQTEVSP
ncbi:PfkB family carbohydrate kinase [Geobacter grbiciae]|uniref:PfkB family carbohydrate kinase n=1 Tax=Geobacter grbiciae TaxID=155042 RepID=UPI001C0249F4|nr:PfkB family carbohydrate kinase [Geobacter grbiciae]MBT1076961.1 sugar kinase [Geobacter grbiciae]